MVYRCTYARGFEPSKQEKREQHRGKETVVQEEEEKEERDRRGRKNATGTFKIYADSFRLSFVSVQNPETVFLLPLML